MSRFEAFMVAVGMILLGMAAARADLDFPRPTFAQAQTASSTPPGPDYSLPN